MSIVLTRRSPLPCWGLRRHRGDIATTTATTSRRRRQRSRPDNWAFYLGTEAPLERCLWTGIALHLLSHHDLHGFPWSCWIHRLWGHIWKCPAKTMSRGSKHYNKESSSLYKTKRSTKDIRAKMNSCLKDDLVMALDYLRVRNQNIYLKESVAHNLICRIENLLPDKCGICEQNYCINKDEPTFLPCKKCGQEAHRECYRGILSSNNIEDILAIIAAIPGLHYLCPTC